MAAGVYYVRTTGNNVNAGTSAGAAWATLAYALTTGAPAAGSIVYVGAGVYRAVLAPTVSGAATATGTNGVTSAAGTTFTDSTANAFLVGMVGQNIEITAGNSTYICKITAYTSSSVITIAPASAAGFPVAAYSSCTWTIGKIAIIGDVDGSQTGDAGQVTITAYTTNDKTAPSASVLLALAATTYQCYSHLTFIQGSAAAISNTAGSSHIAFLDCVVNGATGLDNGGSAISHVSSTTGLAMTYIYDRCFVTSSNHTIAVGTPIMAWSLATTSTGSADFDAKVVVRNCVIMATGAGWSVGVLSTGGNTYHGGGVRLYNCTLMGSSCFGTNSANNSTTVPCEIHNSLLFGEVGGINAAAASQITETYNLIYSIVPRTNVTTGAGSISDGSYAPLIELGQFSKWAMGGVRPFLTPDGAGSPLLGFGTSGASYPTVDFLNRPRPSGGGSASYAVGAYELHDFAIKDTTTYPTGQTAAGKLVGPGDQIISVPVDATATVLTIAVEQGSGYTGTTYATATLLQNTEIGVASQVQTCSSTTGSFQTLTFSSFTPTKQGWVNLQITSYDTSGTGVLWFGALT